jgi:hypothetical protein
MRAAIATVPPAWRGPRETLRSPAWMIQNGFVVPVQRRPFHPATLPRRDEIAARGQGRAMTFYVTGASWVVDGGMLQMGPQAGSHPASDDWRSV